MKLYFIIKSIDEYRSTITHIYDTFDQALEEMKDCDNWYGSKSVRFIYEVDNKMNYIHCWEVYPTYGVLQRY